MPLRPPALRARVSSDPRESASPTQERLQRPLPSRVGPLRQGSSFAPVPPAAEPRAPSTAPIAAAAVDSAYAVFDRYVEEGREYAAGQSAWLHSGNRPTGRHDPAERGARALGEQWSTITRLVESLGTSGRSLVPLSSWIELGAKLLPMVVAEVARGVDPRDSGRADSPRADRWEPWFDPRSAQADASAPRHPSPRNAIPTEELRPRRNSPGPTRS
jgi:hypothetical protein